jgi:NAD(P)-dependent dehydrogenase (short-subunit alcohol dehydrogenase family)
MKLPRSSNKFVSTHSRALPYRNSQFAIPRSVLLTGASTGIGRACVLHLDSLGFRVFATVRNQVDAQSLQAEASGRLVPLLLDVTAPDSIAAACEQVTGEVGDAGLYGLVNNAGIARAGPIEFVPMKDYRLTMEVNFFGLIATTQAFIPLLRQARGRIVNISSVSGLIAAPMVSPYGASKHALEALSDALRVELRPWGVHLSIVNPGNIRTPIWDKSLDAIEDSMQSWPDQVYRLYGPAMEAARRRATSRRGIAPITVARAIEHALTARRPKNRYLVGWDARFVTLFRLLPSRLRDWIIATQLPGYG